MARLIILEDEVIQFLFKYLFRRDFIDTPQAPEISMLTKIHLERELREELDSDEELYHELDVVLQLIKQRLGELQIQLNDVIDINLLTTKTILLELDNDLNHNKLSSRDARKLQHLRPVRRRPSV